MHFLDLRIKSYGCLKFQGEVWAWRACAGANEEELTTCAKFWGQEVGGRGLGEYQKGDLRRSSRQPLVSSCRPLDGQRLPDRRQRVGTSSRPPATGSRQDNWAQRFFFGFFLIPFFFFKFKALACSKGLDFLGGGLGVQHPIFLTMPPTLGSANSSKIHGEWRFHFFPKNNFLYLVHTWTFPSTVGIFVS
jgi:hypothetical protein